MRKYIHPNWQGPIYTNHQRQCSINAAITLVTQLLMTIIESLQNRLQPHSQAIPLWPMRLCRKHRSVDATMMLTLGVKVP